jgi:transposase-like protein
MQKEQKTYTKECKLEAVQLVQSSQKFQAQIARDLGVADMSYSIGWRSISTENSVLVLRKICLYREKYRCEY